MKPMAGRGLGFVVLLAGSLAMALPSFAADPKMTARPQIGQPVQDAVQLLKQKKYKEALDRLRAADAVADKTPYETYVIEGTRAAIDQSSGDLAGAIKALEAVLATNILPAPDALARVQALAQLNYQVKNYPQAIADADRYYHEGGTDDGLHLLTAQAYFLENDFPDATKAIRAILMADDKAGKRPDENLLVMLLNSEFQQKNEAGRIDALQRLVVAYPKPAYWTDLLAAIQKKPGFAARLELDVDRLMLATGIMATADQYMEAAQLALQDGLPGDAKTFLDRGYAAGILGKGTGADREARLATMAKSQAADDVKTLGQSESDADKAGSGDAWVKLGDAYASYGQSDKAIAAFQKGIQKGGLKTPEDARLHLGLAYLASGQKPKAKDTLGAVGGSDGVRDLAQLWLVEAGLK
jgi:tetratricopeptide (TPR) repeat protein